MNQHQTSSKNEEEKESTSNMGQKYRLPCVSIQEIAQSPRQMEKQQQSVKEQPYQGSHSHTCKYDTNEQDLGIWVVDCVAPVHLSSSIVQANAGGIEFVKNKRANCMLQTKQCFFPDGWDEVPFLMRQEPFGQTL